MPMLYYKWYDIVHAVMRWYAEVYDVMNLGLVSGCLIVNTIQIGLKLS